MTAIKQKIIMMTLPEPGVGVLGVLSTSMVGALDSIAGGFDVGGCVVEVKPKSDGGAHLTVFRPGPAQPRDDIEAELQGIVQPWLLGLMLRTGVACDLEWNSGTSVDEHGKREAHGGGRFLVVKKRQAFRTLGAYSEEAALIEAHDELRAALDACVGSRRLVGDHPGAAMGLAYLAVEGLVTFLLGGAQGSRTSAKDWIAAAPLLSSDPDDLHLLLLSTQLGRHVDPKRAKDELQAKGWLPMSDIECAEMALDIVEAYANGLIAKATVAGPTLRPAAAVGPNPSQPDPPPAVEGVAGDTEGTDAPLTDAGG